jgi:ParB-like chromosome segregation protein Spo0J
MIVAGKEVEIHAEDIPIEKLEPDINQPRRYQLELELQTKGLDPASAKKPDGIELASRFDELRGSIIENEGVSMPLVVEKANGTFRIIDGDRRLGAVRNVLADQKVMEEHPALKERLSKLPCIVANGPLTKAQRLALLSHIHVHLAPWGPVAKEKVVMELQEAVPNEQRISAVMGTKPSSIKRQREIYEMAQNFMDAKGSRALSYARELMNIKENLRTPEVKKVTIEKINKGIVDDAVDIRNLRKILPDPDAREVYLKPNTKIEEAMNVIKAKELQKALSGPPTDFKDTVDRLIATLKTAKFEDIVKYKGNRELRKTVDEAITLLGTFRTHI